jgi:hypothetical protein
MTEPVRKQVIDYLLDDLDDSEKEELRAQLESDPACRDALNAAFRVLLRLHRSRQDDSAPNGLAERTCKAMFDPHQRRRLCMCRRRTMTPASAAAGGHPLAGRGNATWVDVAVTCAICVVAGLLVLPAVNGSRFQARLATCQINLERVGQALAEHSYRNHEVFPSVPDKGNLAADGIWAPVLVGEGLLVEPQNVLCPETPLARQGDFQIPSLNQLRKAAGRELAQLQQRMGGSYGYCLGYFDHGVLQPTRNLNRQYFAILADAPSDRPDHQSANHDFLGQNVLYDDFHVAFCSTSRPVDGGDDIYVNDDNEVAPGLRPDDSVLAPSGTPPVVFVNLRR